MGHLSGVVGKRMFHCVVSFVYHFLNFDLIFFILPDFKKGILEFNCYDLGIRDFEQLIHPLDGRFFPAYVKVAGWVILRFFRYAAISSCQIAFSTPLQHSTLSDFLFVTQYSMLAFFSRLTCYLGGTLPEIQCNDWENKPPP